MKEAIKKLLVVLDEGTEIEKTIADNMLCMMHHVAQNDLLLKTQLDKAVKEHNQKKFIEKYGEEEVKSWKFIAYQLKAKPAFSKRF